MGSQAAEARPGDLRFSKSRGGSSAQGIENFWVVVPGGSRASRFPSPPAALMPPNLRVPFPRMGTAVSLCSSEVTGSGGYGEELGL